MIDGPTPLHVIDAPTEGTGKDKLANCFCVLATGRDASTLSECHGEEEWKKTITSALTQGPVYIYFENVNYALRSATLTKAISGRVHQDRVLGKNDSVRVLPVECAWIVTGNNVKASKELTRRMVWIRLDAMMERPDTRLKFKHVLPHWAKKNRGELIWACLTLIRAWIAKGKPKRFTDELMGGFEVWESNMAGILDTVGIPDFLSNRGELFADVNTTDAEWSEFVHEWASVHLSNPVTASDLAQLCEKNQLLPSVLSAATNKPHALGMALGQHQDKIYGGWRIEKCDRDTHAKVNKYRVRQVKSNREDSE